MPAVELVKPEKPSRKARREIAWLCGLCVVGALALAVTAKWKEVTPQSAVISWPFTASAKQVKTGPWAMLTYNLQGGEIALSPDGSVLAGLCPTNGPTARPSGAKISDDPDNDLVFWRVRDSKELFRIFAGRVGHVSWSADGRYVFAGGKFEVKKKAFVTSLSMSSNESGNSPYDLSWTDEKADIVVRGSSDLDTRHELMASHYGSHEPIPLRWKWGKEVVPERWSFALRPGRKGRSLQGLFLNDSPTEYAKGAQGDLELVVVTLGDLTSGKVVWQQHGKSGSSQLSTSWSPDGKVLALIGVKRPRKGRSGNGRGIEFLDGATGKRMSSLTLDYVDFCLGIREMRWLTNSMLMISEEDDKMRHYLRFYQSRTGKRIGCWPTVSFMENIEAMYIDKSGNTWAFANSSEGWRVYSRSQLRSLAEQYFRSMPRPTPKN